MPNSTLIHTEAPARYEGFSEEEPFNESSGTSTERPNRNFPPRIFIEDVFKVNKVAELEEMRLLVLDRIDNVKSQIRNEETEFAGADLDTNWISRAKAATQHMQRVLEAIKTKLVILHKREQNRSNKSWLQVFFSLSKKANPFAFDEVVKQTDDFLGC